MSGGSSEPKVERVSQQATIPGFLQPFVTRSAEISTGALEDLNSQLSGATADDLYAGPDALTLEAEEMLEAVARGEDGFLPTANNELLATARGDYLFGGEGFDAAVDAATRRVMPEVFSAFGSAGRGDSGLARTALGQGIADAFAGQYGNERTRQLAAVAALPGAAGQSAGLLDSIGRARQAREQQELSAPLSAAESLYSTATSGLPVSNLIGMSGTQESPMFRNRAAGLLGGAGTGAGLGTALGFSNPWTLGAFALGGGLLGGM